MDVDHSRDSAISGRSTLKMMDLARLNRFPVPSVLIRLRRAVIASLLSLIESKGRFRDPRSVKSTMSPLQFDL